MPPRGTNKNKKPGAGKVLDHGPRPKPKKNAHSVLTSYGGNVSLSTHRDQVPSSKPERDTTTFEGVNAWLKALMEGPGDDLADVELPTLAAPDIYDKQAEPEEAQTTSEKSIRHESDDPVAMWLKFRDIFLAQLLCREGRQGMESEKCLCGELDSSYLCHDCFNTTMCCSACIKTTHRNNPFHRILKWNGKYFERSSLQTIGFAVGLGHRGSGLCVNVRSLKDFVVLDVNGVHTVTMNFCACGATSDSVVLQLLQAGLFPATVKEPQTAATFQLLDFFDQITYESKASAFEFFQALTRLTDNVVLSAVKDRYHAFSRMSREWKHLKMLKRAGRGHDPLGTIATREGECAVLCPACPQPGKNMTPGWEKASENSFLHTLFLGLDANFRLKRKDVSNEKLDPGLGRGIAYIVEDSAFREYLKKHEGEKEPKSTCSQHNAVNLADAKPGKDYAATGLAKIECIRHEMHRPLGACDLQKGERYCNIDYIVYKTLQFLFILRLVVSYDIACQWFINLMRRMQSLCPELCIMDEKTEVKYLVPKFHLPAHIIECRARFSFNYTPGVGRTDGEGVERAWAEINHLATSTREMGPGTRRDAIDSHLGDANWRKTMGLGISLLRRLEEAGPQMLRHHRNCRGLEDTTEATQLTKWRKEMSAWEKDSSQPNPFECRVELPSPASVRREVAAIEAKNIQMEKDFKLIADMTPLQFITKGLDLEEEQRALKQQHSKIWEHSRDRQRTAYTLTENAFKRKTQAWFQHQSLYMPPAAMLRQKMDTGQETAQETFEKPLWLPSQIKDQVIYNNRFSQIEWELRVAQAYETISEMRRDLFLRAHLRISKKISVRGQTLGTRALNSIKTVQARIDMNAETYRAARVALASLANLVDRRSELNKFPVLEAEDIRELAEVDPSTTDGRSTVTWIWKMEGLNAEKDSTAYIDGLRIEWGKSYCRAMRFTEEVLLVQEEMRRVLRFLHWQAQDWRSKADVGDCPIEMREGYVAYAHRQADLRVRLRDHFIRLWKNVDKYVEGLDQALKNSGSPYIRDLVVQGSELISSLCV